MLPNFHHNQYSSRFPEPIHLDPDAALATDGEDHSERADAADWLTELLASGPAESTQVLREAKDNGISEKTLRRAAKGLGIKRRNSSFNGPWYWSLPEQAHEAGHEDAQDAQHSKVAILGKVGHLGADHTADADDDSDAREREAIQAVEAEAERIAVAELQAAMRKVGECT